MIAQADGTKGGSNKAVEADYAGFLRSVMGPEFRGANKVLDGKSTLADGERIFGLMLGVPERIYKDGAKWTQLQEYAERTVLECRRGLRFNEENLGFRFEQRSESDDAIYLILEGGKMAGEGIFTDHEKYHIAKNAMKIYLNMQTM
jgi:hypothetical protein